MNNRLCGKQRYYRQNVCGDRNSATSEIQCTFIYCRTAGKWLYRATGISSALPCVGVNSCLMHHAVCGAPDLHAIYLSHIAMVHSRTFFQSMWQYGSWLGKISVTMFWIHVTKIGSVENSSNEHFLVAIQWESDETTKNFDSTTARMQKIFPLLVLSIFLLSPFVVFFAVLQEWSKIVWMLHARWLSTSVSIAWWMIGELPIHSDSIASVGWLKAVTRGFCFCFCFFSVFRFSVIV